MLKKFNAKHASDLFTFDTKHCSKIKKYSLESLTSEQRDQLYKRLGHFSKMTWHTLISLSEKSGLTVDKEGTESFQAIENQKPRLVLEEYYFHFRVEQTGKFRVFGYQDRAKFCITHVDPKGNMHYRAHK